VFELAGGIPRRTPGAGREGKARALDVLGVGLFLAAAVWMVWARTVSGGSAAPGVGLLAGCGLIILAVRFVGRKARLLVPAAVLLAAMVTVAWSGASVLSLEPLARPLGYQNANGAFYAQAAVAGLMLAIGGRSLVTRAVGGVAAIAFAALPFMLEALAAALLVLLAPATVLVAVSLRGAERGSRISVAILGVVFAAAMVATIALAATRSLAPRAVADGGATIIGMERGRLALWRDAFLVMHDHPWTGVGPGRYQEVSPIGSRDRDRRWAHNEFLQQGAEGGVVGLILLVALVGWGFTRLGMSTAPNELTALGAASLAALGIHASVDYVLHFPAIPLMCAALVATGMIDSRPRSFQEERGQEFERHDLAHARSTT
jgi:O-antigen ligase